VDLPTRRSDRARRTADRHAEILAAAFELMAEHGYHGASLRELAKRLGISQPSLYHYFSSKDELVEQIIATYVEQVLPAPPTLDPETRLEELPRRLCEYVLASYASPPLPTFIRFMFAVSRVDPRFARRNRELFIERSMAGLSPALTTLAQAHAIAPERLAHVARAILNAIGFRLLEETVLFDTRPIDAELLEFADEVVAMGSHWLAALRERGARAS
jgi:AcrR family transcriptional regulator